MSHAKVDMITIDFHRSTFLTVSGVQLTTRSTLFTFGSYCNTEFYYLMPGSFISVAIVQFVIYGLIDTLSPYIPYCPTRPVF